MAVVEERIARTGLCSVFVSFKTLLFLIYNVIHVLIRKLSPEEKLGATPFIKKRSLMLPTESKTKHKLPLVGGVKQIWEIPGPRSLPFFGTLLTSSALKSSDLMKVNEERQKMYGTIVKEEHFWNFPLIMVLGSEEIKKIVRANPMIRPGMEILTLYRSLRPDRYSSYGLVNSQGPMWKKLHSTFSCVTSTNFVRSLLPVFNDITSDVISTLANEPSPVTGLPRILNEFICEASFYASFGKRMGFVGKERGQSEKLALFSNCHDTYWQAFHKSMYGFPWWKYFPTKVWKEFTAAEDKMIDVISTITEELLESGEAGGVLAEVHKEDIPRNDLNVVLLELITGATEPVFHALVIALYWISKHERVYKKVLEELKEQLPTKDSPVDDAVLDNIPYLKACVTETFRICPTACNLARILDKDLQLGEYRLPARTAVILQTWHACMQDTSFYRAKEYLPERWILEDGVPPFKPHERQVMCNFGMGMRACPGRKIGTQLINTFLCKILRKFKVKFTKEIDLRYEWLLVVKEPIVIELEEHEN